MGTVVTRWAIRAPVGTRLRVTQQGVTLIELLVGIAIGLMTVAVALVALMASRGVAGTVSDVSFLQQQAAYAFRLVASQVRPAGSLRLNLAAQRAEEQAIDVLDPVAFETAVNGFDPLTDSLSGNDAPDADNYTLTVGFRNYRDPLFNEDVAQSLQRNCLGQENSETLIQSRFRWNAESNELQCAGTGDPQPIAHNVANFQVRYLVQPRSAPPGDPKIQYVNASAVSDWSEVTAVQVCIVLYGNEAISLPAGSTYKDCPSNDGTVADIDMTSLPAPRARRLHMSFRNIYQLRSQLAQP